MTMEPSRVVIIRHGEKSRTKGSQKLGMPKGYARASALAPFLPFKFNRIDILYAPSTEAGSQSVRVLETMTPLSRYLNLPILTTHMNSKDDIRKMVTLIRTNPKYHGKTVLICWHHNLIPFLTKEFKPHNIHQVPRNWPKDRFDLIWILTRTPKGIIFSQQPQKLLFGDQTSAIPLQN